MTWEEISADPSLRDLPHKIEQDRFGRIIMSPPPAFSHGRRQARIIILIAKLLPDWTVAGDAAVQTEEGVRSPDVTAMRPEHASREGPATELLRQAPAICVEVLSPGNSSDEMEEKRRLFAGAGCEEFWTCSESGEMIFIRADETVLPRSNLCPAFPANIDV